jgi:hypothetical protein
LSFPDPAFVLPVCTQLCLLVTNKIPINQPIITASSNMGFLPRFPDTHKKTGSLYLKKAAGFAGLPESSAAAISSRDQSPPGSHSEHPEAGAAASCADRRRDNAGSSGDHVATACC